MKVELVERVEGTLPVFNSLRSDQSGSFKSELAFGQVHRQWIQETEGDKAILAHLSRSSHLVQKIRHQSSHSLWSHLDWLRLGINLCKTRATFKTLFEDGYD